MLNGALSVVYDVIDKYCEGNPDLYRILISHSQSVQHKALSIIDNHPELNADWSFVEQAALIHDIGIVKTNAPSISCFGTEPYICHGIIGAEIVTSEGLSQFARVCACHTGTGLYKEDIDRQNLPLPHRDFIPQSVEEVIICFADKFFSKTRLEVEKTPDQVRKSLEKFGQPSVDRFNKWCELFL